jgi:hypothetical protein
VFTDQATDLEHRDLGFAKYFFEFGIGIDHALVDGVLQFVFLDVSPQFGDDLGAWQRCRTDHRCQSGAGAFFAAAFFAGAAFLAGALAAGFAADFAAGFAAGFAAAFFAGADAFLAGAALVAVAFLAAGFAAAFFAVAMIEDPYRVS